eukprot:38231-Chlamydomonas_euryale.AAC.3
MQLRRRVRSDAAEACTCVLMQLRRRACVLMQLSRRACVPMQLRQHACAGAVMQLRRRAPGATDTRCARKPWC